MAVDRAPISAATLEEFKKLVVPVAADVIGTLQQAQATAPEWYDNPELSALERQDPQGWYQRALLEDGVTPGINVQRFAVKSLSAREQEETQAFTRHTLDRRDGRVRPFALRADRYAWETPTWAVLVKAEQRVVSHAGILYRVVEVDGQRIAVGGVCGVMSLPDWQGRGYARAVLKKVEAFVAVWLWAPFALAICPRENASFFRSLGWQVAEAPITCEQPGGRVSLTDEVAVVLPCQGPALWPSGPIDLCGVPW